MFSVVPGGNPISAGGYVITATYNPGTDFNASTGTNTLTISQASSTTTVASSNPSTTYMEAVTFTATVAQPSGYSGTPTGTVSFYNAASSATCSALGSSTQIGTAQTLSAGLASITTASLPGGSDTILVCYSGDPNFYASSGTTSQTVTPAPVLTVSPLSISFGNQSVNTTSSPSGITLTNNGDAVLDFLGSGITVTGMYGSEFPIKSTTCGATLGYTAGSNSCTITLDFAPTDTGTANATLQIEDNDNDVTASYQNVALSGGGLTYLTSGSFYPYAIFATANACGSLTLTGNSTIDSFNSALGYSTSHELSGGNVGTNGNVTLSGNATIYGTAATDFATDGNCNKSTLTGLSTSGGASVKGGLVALNGPVVYAPPATPNPAPPTTQQNISGSCPTGMTGCSNIGSKRVALAPGSYGNVQLSGQTTANLSTGTYSFNSLALSGQSVLYVSSGPIVINLACAGLSGGNTVLNLSGGSIVNPTGIPADLQFLYAGAQGIDLSGGSESYATVYAPNAVINMSGGTDFFGGIVGLTITDSGNTAIHGDSNLPNIAGGDYIWFTAVVNDVKGLPTNGNQVKLYLTNSSIQYTVPSEPNAGTYTVPVPNAVVTFNAASGSFKTTYDLTNNRWSTSVTAADLTGNTFVTAVAVPVPTGGFPAGIQNVQWTAAFSTDEPGITFQWQWSAGVYNGSFGGGSCPTGPAGTACPTSTYAGSSNNDLLGANPEDGSADPYGLDPAGTPENYKQDAVIGFFSAPGAVVPTAAEMSATPSSYNFGALTLTTSSGPTAVVVLTNNDTVPHNISNIAAAGASDFAVQPSSYMSESNCVATTSLPAGGSCTLYVNFTANYTGTESAKISITDNANNSPQTVYLSGSGH
jgi:hypothetical protein